MKKILVVDNDKLILAFLNDVLSKKGHHVMTAEDGLLALDILKTYTPDIIFVDLIMPNISGQKLCKIIRGMENLEDTHIIILSAIAAEKNISVAELRANGCIAKGPFDEMSKHILAAVDQSDLPSSQYLSEKVLGIDRMSPRRVTEELLSDNRHLEIILDRMNEGILEITSEGKIVHLNPAFVFLVNTPEEKLLGSDFVEHFSEDHRQRIRRLLKAAVNKPKKIAENSPVSLNEHQVTLDIVPIAGNSSTSVVIINDVTERKWAEEVIRRANEKLEKQVEDRTADLSRTNELLLREIEDKKRAEKTLWEQTVRNELVLRTAMDGFFLIDVNGKILKANHASSAILGYSAEELSGMNLNDLEAIETPSEIAQHIGKIMKTQSHRFETKHRRKDGTIVDLQVNTSFVKIDEERFFSYFFNDITKKKQMEQVLREREADLGRMNKELLDTNKALSVLATNIEKNWKEVERRMGLTITAEVMPMVNKLREDTVIGHKTELDMLAAYVTNLTSGLTNSTFIASALSSAELRVAAMIKNGLSSPEIARQLFVSLHTIKTHRRNIRKKLNIQNSSVSLPAFLRTKMA